MKDRIASTAIRMRGSRAEEWCSENIDIMVCWMARAAVGRRLMRCVCGHGVIRVGAVWFRPSSNEQERLPDESTMRLEIMMIMTMIMLVFMLIQ